MTLNRRNITNHTLCTECNIHLTSGDNDIATEMKTVWPAFIWGLLKDETIQQNYGVHILRFISMVWRPWWIDSIKYELANIYQDVTLQSPSPIFKDKSLDIKLWNADINSYLLSRLASTSNKYLYPSIMCPWGCSEFQHKVGYLPLDIVF